MSSENPFKILKISPNSGVDEIKQAFRSLILSAHPDVNHESGSNAATEKLIRAYHNALSEAKKKQQPNKDKIDFSLFELQYEFFFGKSFSFPKTKQDFFRQVPADLCALRPAFESACRGPADAGAALLHGEGLFIFESFDCLLNFRSKTLTKNSDEEYKQEKLRMETIRYFQEVASNSGNYLNFRRSLMLSRDYLLSGCVTAINESSSLDYQQEFFTIMSIISLLGDDEILSEWEL
ncbi:MAG: DnaJ domain-containing protein [Spirochaetales bacterium]|nr:DnaJ domain-containing protein [Spirochaetales bacterium]